MAAYLIVAGTIHDNEKWDEYRKAVVPLIAIFGGKQCVKGKPNLLEGDGKGWSTALFEFPSLRDVEAFWTSPQYVPVKAIRKDAATLNIWSVAGA